MIPMWMCPGCGPFSLRRPACALSFGAATWSHTVEIGSGEFANGQAVAVSSTPMFLAQDRWEDRWPNFQVTELLWYISSQFRDMSLSKFQIRAIHQESSWNFLGESLKHIMPWPWLFTFRTPTLCGSSFSHTCCHSSLCVHHAGKVSDRRRLLWCGLGYHWDLQIPKGPVFFNRHVRTRSVHQQIPFLDSDFSGVPGSIHHQSWFIVRPCLSLFWVQHALHLWLSSPYRKCTSPPFWQVISPFLVDKSWWIPIVLA